jgi:hypothetical protein
MKTKVLLFTMLVFMLTLGVTSASAKPSAKPKTVEYYDAQIDVLLPYLESYQADYFAANGRYYQALISHSSAPNVPTPPDGLSNMPSDQDENLAYFWDIAELPASLNWSLKIDTYSGPDGDGYVLTVAAKIQGDIWERSINYGPDTWRAADWYQVIPEP